MAERLVFSLTHTGHFQDLMDQSLVTCPLKGIDRTTAFKGFNMAD